MATATPTEALPDPALAAYEALAPFYDDFTAGYAHEVWLEALAALAAEHGVSGGRLLDAACGTGKSSEPLVRAGWSVTACDLSPAMVRRARERLGTHAECLVADVRWLPGHLEADLVLCLDDSLNYLLSVPDLEACLAGFARVLRPGGLAIFDLNTLATYRSAFASVFHREGALGAYRWTGHAGATAGPGALHEATIEVAAGGGSVEARVHRQRHHTRREVESAARAAGLVPVDCRGQVTGGRLTAEPRELADVKRVHVLRRPESGEEVRRVVINP